MVIEINLVGRLFLSEVLLIIILPLLIVKRGRLLLHPLPRTVIILAFLWLAGQIITDFIRETPFQDWTRGWAKITFLILNFSSIYLLLINDTKRIIIFFIGFLIISPTLDYLVTPTELLLYDPWKFGIGGSVVSLVILFAMWRKIARFRLLPVLLIFALGLFSIYMGSRANGGLLILSAGYLYIHSKPKLRYWLKHLSISRIVIIILAAIFLGWGVLTGYSIAARSGWLGEAAKNKYYQQSGDYGILLGGRAEILVSTQAIRDSPIIGHGSWAKNREYKELLFHLRQEMGYFANEYMLQGSDLIPSHSHLFGVWVEAGILGALFWVWVFYLIVRLLFGLFRIEHDLLPLFVVNAMSALWAILFSSFGAEARLSWAFFIVLFIFAVQLVHRSKSLQLTAKGTGVIELNGKVIELNGKYLMTVLFNQINLIKKWS